jgi:GAF domain-containing protein
MASVNLAALLFDRRIDLLALGASIFALILIFTLQQLGIYQFRADIQTVTLVDWIEYLADFSIVSIILLVAINQLKGEFSRVGRGIQGTFEAFSSERARMEEKVRESTGELETQGRQIRSSAAISRSITELRNVTELMETMTRQISDQFGFFHVGIYVLDERKRTMYLQASSSSDQVPGQAFRLEPNRLNPINMVIEHNRPHISTSASDVNYLRGTDSSLTRSRMILPLTVRNNVIGIMDIHSDQPQSFNIQVSEILQSLADLTAVSIDNARLIDEIQNLTQQLESNISDQIRETWTKFTSRHKPAYQYTPAGVRPLFANTKLDRHDGLRVPLVLHGQNIGDILLKRKGSSTQWSDRERDLVEKVADQVALALENSRLVDETQKSAMRDQMIANISARIRETLDVEAVLRTATTELRRVFDLKEAEVSIGLLQQDAPVKKHTSTLRLKSRDE